MKFKFLTKEQLIISLDRLTRFKPAKDKYFRVFSDIILSNLLEPVYKKSDLLNMHAAELTSISEKIINSSLEELIPRPTGEGLGEGTINSILKEYENSVFINDEDTQSYLNNKINYNLFITLIDESSPINLRWLKALSELRLSPQYDDITICHSEPNINLGRRISKTNILKSLRYENGYKFPIEKVLLVEGITEEILLPVFSRYLGYDFYKEGIQILAAGGKNQVVKMYYKLIEELKIPIFVLLDKDAEDNINQIKPKLRDIDKIHLVSCGEFEDLLPKSLIIKTLNNELTNFASVTEADFNPELSSAENLDNIFKIKGLHEFKKAEFAKLVKDSVSEDSDISPEIASIIMEIGL